MITISDFNPVQKHTLITISSDKSGHRKTKELRYAVDLLDLLVSFAVNLENFDGKHSQRFFFDTFKEAVTYFNGRDVES